MDEELISTINLVVETLIKYPKADKMRVLLAFEKFRETLRVLYEEEQTTVTDVVCAIDILFQQSREVYESFKVED